MDAARQLDRFGRDGDHGPLLAFVTLSRGTGTLADREVLLGFNDAVDALSFADWWGLEGERMFARHLTRSRIPLARSPVT